MSDTADTTARHGMAYGLGAYGLWGLLPLYFRVIGTVAPTEIVAQRIIWSVLLVGGLILIARRGAALRWALADRRAMLILAGSATLIAVNWLTYIWAVTHGHVLESSLGYFLNPLVNVVLGVVLLKERLRPFQTAAVLLAACGVAVLAAGAGTGLLISLTLALTFGFYGLLRKVVAVESLEGVAIETLLLAPFALAWLIWLYAGGGLAFGHDAQITALLIAAGPVTAVPLLLFAAAARRMPYAALGVLQYLAPTIQFALAITVFGEHMTTAHMICFAFIWAGLMLYAADAVRIVRRPAVAGAEPA